jgi:DNA-binding transcriptional LysR family regulator
MNPRQLEAYNAVMRTGSVTGAARLLHISQPSVSRLLAELERSTGFALFTRAGRGLAPTREGRRFHQAVESLFLGIDRLTATARRIRESVGDSISVGTIPALMHDLVPAAVAGLRTAYPDTETHVAVGNTPGLVEGVLLQQYDLGVISGSFPRQDLHTLCEISLPCVCLVPSDHALASSPEAIDLNRLRGEEFVLMDQPFPDPSPLEKQLRRSCRITSGSMPALAALARHGGQFALVDPYTAQTAAALGGVVVRRVVQRFGFPYAVICRSEESLALSARNLAQRLIAGLTGDSIPVIST